MSANEICFASATELAARIRRRDLSPVEAVEAFLERIHARNDRLNAYVCPLDEEARERARQAEQEVASGAPLGALHGVPIAIKDLFDFKSGVANTFGCKPLADFVPEVSATYVHRLEAAGGIVLGKTNTPEFGHKGITDNRLFGPTSTPYAPGKNAGGSSGGSAAAVADGMAALAQGSDGGGSIRIPAAWCNLVGFKASYGRVAQAVRPDAFLSHTPFIHAGPLARTVDDAALMLAVISGPDPGDPLSMPDEGVDFLGAPRRGVSGLRVGYSPDFGAFPLDPRVRAVVDEAVRAFETAGAAVERAAIDLGSPQGELSEVWLREIGMLYAGTVQAMKDQGIDLLGAHRDELDAPFAELVERCGELGILDYKRDELVRTTVYDAIEDALADHDVLVTATLATPPVDNADDRTTVGAREVAGEKVDPLIGWCLTYPVNFTGHPAASIPAGFTDDGLPVGLQVVGRPYADADVIAVSRAIERAQPWGDRYPPGG